MKKILAFGEVLLRLSPPHYQTLTQATSLDCQFGGSEWPIGLLLSRVIGLMKIR